MVGFFVWKASRDLPDYESLAKYEPPVMTRIHAHDGSLMAEYARERRIFVPINVVPKLVIAAFLSAEDKRFYEHGGLDFTGIGRAGSTYLHQHRTARTAPEGASTITQQVAKNFLLSSEQNARAQAERGDPRHPYRARLPKDKILELYLNEIYLGMGSYGVAAAGAQLLQQGAERLDIEEAAYLAALPKAPNNYHPFRRAREATIRRTNHRWWSSCTVTRWRSPRPCTTHAASAACDALAIWERCNHDALMHAAGLPTFAVDHQTLVEDPAGVAKRMVAALAGWGVHFDEELDGTDLELAPRDRFHRAPDLGRFDDPVATAEQRELFRILADVEGASGCFALPERLPAPHPISLELLALAGRARRPARRDRDRAGVRPDRGLPPTSRADVPRAHAAGTGPAVGRVAPSPRRTDDRLRPQPRPGARSVS